MLGLRIALVIALAATSACSLALDFDKPTDAAPPDSPATEVECAVGEPNETASTPTAWTGTDVSAAICGGGDKDYYAVELNGSQTIAARITFMNRLGMGDLELRLLTAGGAAVLDESRTSNNEEVVMCPGGDFCQPLAAGTYILEVQGFSPSVISPYVLSVSVVP